MVATVADANDGCTCGDLLAAAEPISLARAHRKEEGRKEEAHGGRVRFVQCAKFAGEQLQLQAQSLVM